MNLCKYLRHMTRLVSMSARNRVGMKPIVIAGSLSPVCPQRVSSNKGLEYYVINYDE